jgi:plasmid stability protein
MIARMDAPQGKSGREDWDLTEDEHRELLRQARERVPVLREIAATNLAEIKRLQEDYARRVARRRRWWIFG